MTFGVLTQVLFDLIMLAGVAFLWTKLSRPQKDDPRLSRGLQLLQSKIAVLEDLSDQVETQVQQISALIESKGREIQTQILNADKQIQQIQVAMGKSLEVAQIFQDRIPHQEIIERQNTIKYVRAARMAHQGYTVDQIAEQVDLAHGEIELIAKVNRDQLQFSEEDLPEWAKEGAGPVGSPHVTAAPSMMTAGSMDPMISAASMPNNSRGVPVTGTGAGFGLAAQSPTMNAMQTEIPSSSQNMGQALNLGLPATGEFLDTKPLARVHDRAETSLSNLGEKFRQALPRTDANQVSVTGPTIEMPRKTGLPSVANMTLAGAIPVTGTQPAQAPTATRELRGGLSATVASEKAQSSSGKSVDVQKVLFPRIDMTQHLS